MEVPVWSNQGLEPVLSLFSNVWKARMQSSKRGMEYSLKEMGYIAPLRERILSNIQLFSNNDGQLVVALQKCLLEMGRQFLEFNLSRSSTEELAVLVFQQYLRLSSELWEDKLDLLDLFP
ncbi:hypothetical protein Tco_1318908 [Tanacetum coccineum]